MSVLSSRLTSHPKFFFSKLAVFVVKFSIIKGFFFFLFCFFSCTTIVYLLSVTVFMLRKKRNDYWYILIKVAV